MDTDASSTSATTKRPARGTWIGSAGLGRRIRLAKLAAMGGAICSAVVWVCSALGWLEEGLARTIASGVGPLLVAAGLAAMVFSVRCQRCKSRPVVHFLRTSQFNSWLFDLEAADQCPRCGDSGKTKK